MASWAESEASLAGRDGIAAIREASEGVIAGTVGDSRRAGSSAQGHGRACPSVPDSTSGDREGGRRLRRGGEIQGGHVGSRDRGR